MNGSDFMLILRGSEIVCNVRGGVVRVCTERKRDVIYSERREISEVM